MRSTPSNRAACAGKRGGERMDLSLRYGYPMPVSSMAAKLKQPPLAKAPRTTASKQAAPRKGRRGRLKLAGWAKDDPLYDEAMKLGAQWRKAS